MSTNIYAQTDTIFFKGKYNQCKVVKITQQGVFCKKDSTKFFVKVKQIDSIHFSNRVRLKQFDILYDHDLPMSKQPRNYISLKPLPYCFGFINGSYEFLFLKKRNLGLKTSFSYNLNPKPFIYNPSWGYTEIRSNWFCRKYFVASSVNYYFFAEKEVSFFTGLTFLHGAYLIYRYPYPKHYYYYTLPDQYEIDIWEYNRLGINLGTRYRIGNYLFSYTSIAILGIQESRQKRFLAEAGFGLSF